MSIRYTEPEYNWGMRCTSGHMMTILVEINAKLDHIAAQRTYEQMEMDLVYAQHAEKLLERAPFAAMRECAEAFGQWYDQWRIGYDAESAAKVYAWLTSVGEMFDRQGRKLGG